MVNIYTFKHFGKLISRLQYIYKIVDYASNTLELHKTVMKNEALGFTSEVENWAVVKETGSYIFNKPPVFSSL